MKKTQEIIGLPIINIYEGTEVGRVKNIIVNAEKRAIEYLVVDSGIQFLSAKILPIVNVLGIGEYAVTIDNESVISYLNEIPAAIELVQKNIQVTGTKLLTKKGRLIGEAGDIYVDENDNCDILGLEYVYNDVIKIIPRTSIISISKNFVVVIEEVEKELLDNPKDLVKVSCPHLEEENTLIDDLDHKHDSSEDNEFELKELITEDDEPLFKEIDTSYDNMELESDLLIEDEILDFSATQEDNISYDDYFSDEENINLVNDFDDIELDDISFEESPSLDSDMENVSASSSAQSGAANLFEQRQKEYLSGRKVTKTITTNTGLVIINQGETITDEVIELSKQNGKLIELIMNNEA